MTINDIYASPGPVAARPERIAGSQLRGIVLDRAARRVLIAVAAGFFLLRLWAMFALPLTDTTEARYAEIARKMVETGNWLTPQFDYGVPFWGKPPLHTWLSAAGMQVFGVSEAAARLPILLSALAVLALVWLWVRDIVGRDSALVVTVVLATMGMFFGASAFVMTDMPVVLGATLVMVGFWNALGRKGGGSRWGYAVFLGLAVGMLAKGPVAVVLCAIPLILWLALSWNWHLLRRLPWIRGTALLLVLVVPWYAAAEIATPGFLRYFLIGEHVQRFLTPGWQGDLYGSAHLEAKGMIWPFWLIAALPWSLALLPLLSRPRATLGVFRRDGAGWLSYLLLWALSPLLLFTPASNILAAYVLPGLPAAAILLVMLFAGTFGPQPGPKTRFGFATAALTGFVLFLALAMVAAPGQMRLKSDKGLVAAASAALPGAPLYTLGARSFSAEFYSRGKARAIDQARLAQLAASGAPAAFSLPPDKAGLAAGLGLHDLGVFGRHVLFVTQDESKVK